jgi:hypothetical protein
MISYRANLFESLNKQNPVIFGQTWIKIIDSKPFLEIPNVKDISDGDIFLVSYKSKVDMRDGIISLMGLKVENLIWDNHSLRIDRFKSISRSAYRIVPCPLNYKYKIGQTVYTGRPDKVISLATGIGEPETKCYLLEHSAPYPIQESQLSERARK